MRVYKEKSPSWEIIKWYLIAFAAGMLIGASIDTILMAIFSDYKYGFFSIIATFIALFMMNRRFTRAGIRYEGCLRGGKLGLGLGLLVFLFVYYVYEASRSLVMPPIDHIIGSIQAGFMEEIMFRMIPITIMIFAFKFNEKKYRLIMFITAFIFSAFHLTNLIVGANVQATIIQFISTFGSGMILAAVFLRCGNGWPLILCHFINNFVSSMQAANAEYGLQAEALSTRDSIVAVALAAISFVLALYYTRESKRAEITEIWKSKFKE